MDVYMMLKSRGNMHVHLGMCMLTIARIYACYCMLKCTLFTAYLSELLARPQHPHPFAAQDR